MDIKERLKMILINGKIEFIFAMTYVIGTLILLVWFINRMTVENSIIVMFPFIGTLTIILLTSSIVKALVYRDALLALKLQTSDKTEDTLKKMKSSAKHTFESSIFDIFTTLIYLIYTIWFSISNGINGKGAIINLVVILIITVIITLKSIMNIKTFLVNFK